MLRQNRVQIALPVQDSNHFNRIWPVAVEYHVFAKPAHRPESHVGEPRIGGAVVRPKLWLPCENLQRRFDRFVVPNGHFRPGCAGEILDLPINVAQRSRS